MSDRDGRLASIRRVDWRFLLPRAAFGTVAVIGAADDTVFDGLGQIAERVVRAAGHGALGEDSAPDLVVTIAATRPVLKEALRLVPEGGWIYAGAGPRGVRGRAPVRAVGAALQSAGFTDIRRSWHWPSEPAALEIVSLDDAPAVRFTLARRRSGRAARVKATMAGVALRVHLLDRIVPGWSVVGRRPTAEEAGSASNAIDPVRANVPDGGGAGAAVVLLTPRFRASRHVIGLVLRPAGDGLAAVVKLARLSNDHGGIRREAEALRRAGELGVSGVPLVLLFRDAPDPALVESALDGVVIAGREVRAAPEAAISEVEAWTAALAGMRGERIVPLRTLWAPALERVAAHVGDDTSSASAAIGKLADRTGIILGALGESAVPVVLEHGDLAPPNLLRLRGGGLGVIDWEVADLEGLPLGDLLFFAAFVRGDPSGLGAARTSGSRPPASRSPIERQAQQLGIDTALIPALQLAMWARWADRQLGRFVDRTLPLEDKLPARHVQSWAAAVDDMGDSD
jgi:aminoglycoside phosphotransferase (APT) family kinase protein